MDRNPVYKTIQITGTSLIGSDDAVKTGIEKASKTLENLSWFRVTDCRGEIEEGRIARWQVTMELGFELK